MGYGQVMVPLALGKCREFKIDDVLVCCFSHNIASAKTILHCGGILENEVVEDGEIVHRYWINGFR